MDATNNDSVTYGAMPFRRSPAASESDRYLTPQRWIAAPYRDGDTLRLVVAPCLKGVAQADDALPIGP
jgi:hypothetical protein